MRYLFPRYSNSLSRYTLDTPQPTIPVPTPVFVAPAGPPRNIPLAPHGKPEVIHILKPLKSLRNGR